MDEIAPKAPTLSQYIMFGAEMGIALYFYCWWSPMLTFFVKAEHILRFEDPQNNGARVQEFLLQCAGKTSDACDKWWISERLCSFVRSILIEIQFGVIFLENRGQFQKGSGWVSLIRVIIFSYHAIRFFLLLFAPTTTMTNK